MARRAIANIEREYPNAPGSVLRSADDLRPPRDVHPAFFGSFDWHSSVHQHWLLVRLLRLGSAGDATDAARAALTASLTPSNLAIEAAYLRDHPAFERTYGWAWILALADELDALARDDVAGEAATWRGGLDPLVIVVRDAWLAYLPRAAYPIRVGTHANSAFGLAFAVDHARGRGDAAFAARVEAAARAWFLDDRAYPAHLEPGGTDFLSPALTEAVLAARILGPDAFGAWFDRFLPEVPASLLVPVDVADRADPQIVHLDGLNLSRAWAWRAIAREVAGGTTAHADLGALALEAADRHLDAALPHLESGEYVGEHWLSTFALLALTE